MSHLLVRGNSRRIPLASGCAQCVVTSPPYFGMRDYGSEGQIGLEPTPDEYISALVGVFREIWRVLRDDGVLWLNLGDSYAMDAKWGGQSGWRHTAEANGAAANRRRKTTGLKPKDLVGIPWRVAFALQADGWYLRSDCIWSKPNPMPEGVTDRPTKSHEYVFLLAKQERYFYDADAVKETATGGLPGNVSHGKYSDHLKSDRDGEHRTKNGLNAYAERVRRTSDSENVSHVPGTSEHSGIHRKGSPREPLSRNVRSVWSIPTQPFHGSHFATMPPALAERCIKAGSRFGDLVVDPFNGSGTSGMKARELGRSYIGVDLSQDYLNIAEERIASWLRPVSKLDTKSVAPLLGQLSLFDTPAATSRPCP